MYPIPANATRIKYLESTGTQYIDTGYVYSENSVFSCDAELTTYPTDTFATLFGSVVNYQGVFIALNNTVPIQARFGSSSVGNIVSELSVADAVGVRHTFGLSNRKLSIDSDEYTRDNFTMSSIDRSVYIYTGNDNVSGNLQKRLVALKLYGFKIWDNGIIVRSFVPVRIGSTGCVFDRVTGQFFYNQGTGSFVCGEDDFSIFSHAVKHVEVETSSRPYDAEVEYIESTGTQYVDTGIYADASSTEFDLDCSFSGTFTTSNTTNVILDGHDSSNVSTRKAYQVNFGGTSGQGNMVFCWFEYPYVQGHSTIYKFNNTFVLERCHLKYTVGTVTRGNVSVNVPYSSGARDRTLLLAASMQDDGTVVPFGAYSMRVYSFRIWDNGALVRDFIPVRVGTEYCLYDKANPTGGDNGDGLYHNKGTGAFLGGSDTGPSIVLASRVIGDSSGTVKAVRKHYDMPMQYTIDECNGNAPTAVNVYFPSGTYDALDYTPTWEHHRFVGWYSSPYDAEIEYIENSGTQYIDNLFVPTSTTKVELAGLFYSTQSPAAFTRFGSRYSMNQSCFAFNANGSNGFRLDLGTVSSGSAQQWQAGPYTATKVIIDAASKYAAFLTDTGSLVEHTFTSNMTFTNALPLALFSFYTGSHNIAWSMRVSYLKIWDNNVLVRDFIPIRTGTVGAMYDKVSGITYWNAGTGDFTKGTDTSSFTSVEVSPSDTVVFDRPTVYARWQLPTTVTFDATTNGGQMPSGWVSPDYYEGQPYGTLPTPTKSGETFLGWFTSGGTRITTSSAVSSGTLTARYMAVTWATTYSCTTTSTYKKTGIYSANRYSSSDPIVVDWGDGTTDVVYGNISQLAHTYPSATTYTVKISDNISTFCPSYSNSTWYQTTSQNQYTFKKVLTLSSKVTQLSQYAFYYCAAMTDAVIPSGATSIPNYCFYYCSTLKSSTVQLPSTVTSIGSYAFYSCSGSNFNAITIPAACTSISSYAFYCCYYLHPSFASGSSNLSLNTYSFGYCGYNGSAFTIDMSPRKVTSIPNYCFYYCRYLKGITWPQNVTSIGSSAFRYCFYASSACAGTIEIPEGVTSISGTYAFANCLYLTAVTLPSTLTNLNNYTFYYCTRLATITSNRSTAPTVSAQTFGNSSTYYTGRTSYSAGTNKLYVPAGATGYDSSYWLSPLCNSTMCGFTLVQAVSITFDATTNGGQMPSGWTAPNYWPGLSYGTLPLPTKSNATFDGWYLNGTKVTETDTVPSGGCTLVAQFISSSPQSRSAPAGMVYIEVTNDVYNSQYQCEIDASSVVVSANNYGGGSMCSFNYTASPVESIDDAIFDNLGPEEKELVAAEIGISDNEFILCPDDDGIARSGTVYPEFIIVVGYNNSFGSIQRVSVVDMENLQVLVRYVNDDQSYDLEHEGDLDGEVNDYDVYGTTHILVYQEP